MRFWPAAVILLLAAGVALIFGGDDAPPATPVPDDPVTVKVEVHDAPPVQTLQRDGRECVRTEVVEIEVRSADGVELATEALPARGGTFTASEGCRWPLEFEVAASAYYEVTLRYGAKTQEGKVRAVDGVIVVDLTF